jgi:exo-beta-1,3-glucanase (GH17 family)
MKLYPVLSTSSIMAHLALFGLCLCWSSSSKVATAEPIQLYGLNYNTRQGPDWDWDKCKSYERIQQDLQLLQRLTPRIRLLSLTDCGQGDMVMTVAQDLGMKLWLGLWV